MEKIEILGEFKKKYGERINPMLTSFKYCQSDDNAFTEIILTDQAEQFIIDLEFIAGGIDLDDNGEEIVTFRMFDHRKDLIDNAKLLIEFDEYSLINCIDHLFTKEAIDGIVDRHSKTIT